MAYRAEIEIAVKGAQELNRFKQKLEQTSKVVDNLNVVLEVFGQGLPRNINNLNQALASAASNFNKVALETDEARLAAVDYLNATRNLNAGLQERARLLVEVAENERKAKLASAGIRETTQYPGPIGPGAASAARLSSNLEQGRLRQRAKGLNQYERPIFPQPDVTREIVRRNKIRAITRATAKIEKQRTQRLAGQNSLTNGLLGLNKAVLNAARSEAQARGESVAEQRELNRELAKTQQKSKELPGGGKGKGRTKIGRAVGAGLSTVNLPGQDIAQAAFLGSIAGPKGAAIAAGIAVVAKGVEGLVRLGPEAAKTEASLNKLGIALRGILGSQSAEGFKAIDRAARDFNQPIVDATQNFTQLSAAAAVNGNTVKEIETLYRGLSAATKATGGNAEDLSGVLRAATQVISKGVVRSEELRGQIGDRLPGAFQLFAQATNRSAEELQKALEQGEVSADEFVTTFANFILNKYEPAAKKIGDSPAEAGARLTKALEDANRAAGPLLSALGAKFQDFATKTIRFLTPLANYFNDLFNITPATPAAFKKIGAELKDVGEKLGRAEERLSKATNEQTRKAAQEDIASLENRRQKLAKEFSRIAVALPSKTEEGAPLLKKTTVEDVSKPGKADKAAERAAREEERLQERLAALRIEINLAETNANFKSKITAAEIAGNKELVIRLENLKDIANIQANEQKALVRIDDARERSLIKQKTAADINAANVEAAAQLALIENQRQQAFDKQIESLNFEYSILTATTIEERKRLQIAQEMAALKGENFTPEQLNQIQAAKERLDIGPIQTYVNDLQLSLSDTETMVVSLAQSVEDSLATAMSSAVETLITGTGSVQEAFSDMFANIGKAFIDMATQMLAQKAIMSLLGALGGGIGGGGGGGDGAFNIGKALTGRATGGPVNANQPYIVGERGPELMIPSSQGRIISNENLRSEMDRSAATRSAMARNPGAGVIDVRYSVERINNVDYVTASEFQQGMAQAAKQGAVQGEQRAMRTLKNSASTRRSVGF